MVPTPLLCECGYIFFTSVLPLHVCDKAEVENSKDKMVNKEISEFFTDEDILFFIKPHIDRRRC
ncbi:hypothetical protein A1OU_10760 [Enterovibrio norvegicus]|nr:hypothetical protein A1OU_10760 [Enterovibrio norvegicus]